MQTPPLTAVFCSSQTGVMRARMPSRTLMIVNSEKKICAQHLGERAMAAEGGRDEG